jgi:hypothetical protein
LIVILPLLLLLHRLEGKGVRQGIGTTGVGQCSRRLHVGRLLRSRTGVL